MELNSFAVRNSDSKKIYGKLYLFVTFQQWNYKSYNNLFKLCMHLTGSLTQFILINFSYNISVFLVSNFKKIFITATIKLPKYLLLE